MQSATAKNQEEMGYSVQMGADVQVEAKGKYEKVFGLGPLKGRPDRAGPQAALLGPMVMVLYAR